jgi:parvulin-like peptidyl-prolyl isomerase
MDSEQSARLLLIGAAVAVVAIAVGFVAFGWYWTEYRPRFRTVLEVEGQKVSFEAMQRRIEYEYFSNIALQSDPGVLPTVAYSNLVEEKLLLARAGELGVTAEDAEVETKLRQRVGVAADASNEDFGERYRDVLDVSGLTDGEYRNIAVSEVLKEKVLTKFTLETANSLEQAQLDVILTASESDAQAAIARINSGEAWDAVAKDVSLESDVQVTGGRKGYTPSGGFIPAYDDYAFTGAVGAVSAPLRASDTEWYVVRIVDRSLQPLTEEQKNDVARTKYDEWVVGLRETASIIDNWTTDTEAQIEALTPIIERGTQPVQRQPVATIAVPTLAPATPAAPPAPADGQ